MRLAIALSALIFLIVAPQQAEARSGLFKGDGIFQKMKAKRAERKAQRAAKKVAKIERKAKKQRPVAPVYTQEDRIDVPPPEVRRAVSSVQEARKKVQPKPQTLVAAKPSPHAKVVLAKAAANLKPKSLVQPARLSPPDPRPASLNKPVTSLRLVLDDVERHFGPVKIVSQCRPGAKIAGTGRPSKHASCNAIDFAPPPGKYDEVAAWLKANHNGGVGTYSGHFHHIHIDLGGHARWHN